MQWFDTLALGFIQGISEFLPISSSAHLTIYAQVRGLINPQSPEQWTAYLAIIQLGTLVAVVGYFWQEIYRMVTAFFGEVLIKRKRWRDYSWPAKEACLVLLGSIPIVVLGFLLKKVIEGDLTKNLVVIGSMLIFWGLLLGVSEYVTSLKRGEKDLRVMDAFWMGLGQTFALIPGASRSGTTITFGLFAGLSRSAAARFSFLLSLPAVVASSLLQLFESRKFFNPDLAAQYGLGILVSLVVGYLSIRFLLHFLQKNSTAVFVVYRLVLGAGIIVWSLWR